MIFIMMNTTHTIAFHVIIKSSFSDQFIITIVTVEKDCVLSEFSRDFNKHHCYDLYLVTTQHPSNYIIDLQASASRQSDAFQVIPNK